MRTSRFFGALILGALLPVTACSSGRGTPAATGPAPCSAADLHAAFAGVQFATGNDFGSLVVWNTGSEPCRLAGTVTFTAYTSSGARDPQAKTVATDVSVSGTLAADMAPYRDGADLTGYVAATVMGAERDDPGRPDGLCRKTDELTPDTLVLGIGRLTLRVANLDSGRGGTTARSVYGCHGKIYLEQVASPRG